MSSTLDFSPEWNGFRRWYWIVAALLALLLLLLWFTGFGPGGSKCKQAMAGYCADNAAVVSTPAPAVVAAPPAAPAAVVAAPAAVETVAVAVAVAPAAAVALPATVIYFAKDKFDMPIGADQKLVDVVAFLQANANAKAVLSGFHDPSGNLAHNEELALNRARSVRSALEVAGIVKDRVVMQKPAVTAGGGAAEEARRVEVSVRPE
jgi:outer membrane protein OmpA-like peptidoglycan-associated protein